MSMGKHVLKGSAHLIKSIERVDIIRNGVYSQPQWVFLSHLQCLRPRCTKSHHHSLPTRYPPPLNNRP